MLWSCDIEKSLEGEIWTNRYILNTPDLPSARIAAQSIVNAEQNVHADIVNFLRFRVSDLTPGTDVYSIVDINEVGEVNTSELVPNSHLPLFNVVRVDFTVEAGRPSRKYLRCPVFEEWQANGVLAQPTIDFFNINYVGAMTAIQAFVDVDGQAIIGGSVSARVGMRQLRRGSKRRGTPIL